MKITMRHILENCIGGQGTVAAGENGLSRIVTKITISELEDALEWFQGGEIVCSTGAVLVNNTKLQKTWIEEMSRIGVAGMILKPDRFLGKIPDIMIESANKNNFPIITVPIDVVWPNIIDRIINMVVDLQTENLRYSFKLHNDLTHLVLSSKPVHSVISMLSKMSGCPVILEDQRFNTMHYTCGETERSREYTKLRIAPEYQKKLRGLIDSNKGNKMPEDLLGYLPDNIKEKPMLMMPIIAGEHFFGWLSLIVLREEYDVNMCKTILDHGSTVVALSLLNDYTRFISSAQENSHFIKYLTNEIPVTDKNFRKASSLLGIDLEAPTIVIAIEIRIGITSHCFDALKEAVQSFDSRSVFCLDKNKIIIFFHPRQFLSLHAATNEAVESVKAASFFFGCTNADWSAGISNLHSTQDSIKTGYNESILCLNKAIREKQNIVVATSLGLEKVFALVLDKDKLPELSYQTLEKLLVYDDRNNTELTLTLRMYLKNRYNKALTARELNIHLNTLNYRLERINEIMELDLEDSEACALLIIAMNIKYGGGFLGK